MSKSSFNYLEGESEHFPGLKAGTDLEKALLSLKSQAAENPITSLPVEVRAATLAEVWLKGKPRIIQGAMTAVAYGEHLDPIIGEDAFGVLRAQGLLSFVV